MSNKLLFRTLVLATVFAGLILSSGCTANKTATPEDTKPPTIILAKSFSWLKNLEDNTYISAGGITTVVVRGVSSSSLAKKVVIKTEWFTATGQPVSTVLSRWEHKTLQPKLPFTYTAVAPAPNAVNYQVLITDKIK